MKHETQGRPVLRSGLTAANAARHVFPLRPPAARPDRTRRPGERVTGIGGFFFRTPDPERITASMDNGVLSLIVPKPERLKPKTIAINAGETQHRLEPATA